MTDPAQQKDTSSVTYNGEEDLRFIRNFHDIFLSIGLGMFIVGIGIVAGRIQGSLIDFESIGDEGSIRTSLGISVLIWAGSALLTWVLAEVFARTRRLFLPGIVIFIGYTIFATSAASTAYFLFFADTINIPSLEEAFETIRSFPLYLSTVMALVVFAFYLRMKLPFAMGVGGLVLASFIYSVFALIFDFENISDTQHLLFVFKLLFLASGVLLFVLGLIFDARDPMRATRQSDNAFWLHFFAAPILFGSVMSFVTGSSMTEIGSAPAAVTTLLTVGVFAVISLLINRRALLVAGLLSAAISIGVLINQADLDTTMTLAITLLMLGGVMVLLGGAWHSIRRALVAPFPKTGIIARIIPPVTIGA